MDIRMLIKLSTPQQHLGKSATRTAANMANFVWHENVQRTELARK